MTRIFASHPANTSYATKLLALGWVLVSKDLVSTKDGNRNVYTMEKL